MCQLKLRAKFPELNFWLRQLGDNFVTKLQYTDNERVDLRFASFDTRYRFNKGNWDFTIGAVARIHQVYGVSPIEDFWIPAESTFQDLAENKLNIDISEGTPSTQLGPNMGMGATSLSRSLNKLEGAGVIVRKPDPSDKRKALIHLTPLGMDWREVAKGVVLEFNKKIQYGLRFKRNERRI